MPRIIFVLEKRTVEVASGTTILDAALEHDVPLNHNCGGNCACSTCHVIVESGLETLNDVTADELEMLEEADHLTDKSRLACQSVVTDDLVVRIPLSRVM